MRKLMRIGAISFALLLAIVGLVLVGGWWGARQVPEFYERALAVEPGQYAEQGDRLEENLLELRNDAREEGRWQAVFTDEQINGWLAADLPEKFPRVLPKQLKDPRVAIEPDVARVAARYESRQLTTVISLAVDVHLTDEPNVLAVRIHQVRAGLLPVPLADWLDRVSLAASKGGIPLRWTEQDGDPVALVTIPLGHANADRILRLEQIELRDGELVLIGRTGREEDDSPMGLGEADAHGSALVHHAP